MYLFGTSNWFRGSQFFRRLGGDGFRMIQEHYIHCALYSYYYYISSTSDHQTLDPGGCGPLPYVMEGERRGCPGLPVPRGEEEKEETLKVPPVVGTGC